MNRLIKTLGLIGLCIISYLLILQLSLGLAHSKFISKINKGLPKGLSIKNIKLKVFPYPHINIQNIDYKKPFEINANIESLGISIDFLGLFSHKFISANVQGGKIIIYNIKGNKKGTTIPIFKIPIGFIEINNLQAVFFLRHKKIDLFQIHGLIISNGHIIRITGKGNSNILNSFDVNLNISKTEKSINLHLNKVVLSKIVSFLPKKSYFQSKRTSGALDININANIIKNKIKGIFHLTSPSIFFISRIDSIDLLGNFIIDPDSNSKKFSIKRLRIGEPYIDLWGDLNFSKNNVNFNLSSKKIDISELRSTYLNSNINIKLMNKIFDIVQGGVLKDSRFSLKKNKHGMNWAFTGNTKNTSIDIPHIKLSLYDLSGHLKIENNILECRDISGKYRNSMIKEGYLLLGLNKQLLPFNIKTNLKYNLKDLLPLLISLRVSHRIIGNLNKFHIDSGTTVGNFNLIKNKDGVYNWDVDLRDLTVNGNIKGLKMPYKIRCKEFRINRHILKSMDTSIFLPYTKVHKANIEILFDKKNIRLELNNTLLNTQETKDIIYLFYKDKFPFEATGSIYFKKSLLTYDFSCNKILHYSFIGKFNNLKLNNILLKDFLKEKIKNIKTLSISISDGNFYITKKKLLFNSLQLYLLKSNLFIKKFIFNKGIYNTVNMELSGTIEKKLQKILKKNISILDYINSSNSWHINNIKLDLISNKSIKVNSDIILNGVHAVIKISKPKNTELFGNLMLSYNREHSFIYFKKSRHNLFLKFKGSLTRSIANRLLDNNKYIIGDLKGDCIVKINLDPIFFKEFKGDLLIKNFLLHENPSILAEYLHIRSNKNIIFIDNSKFIINKDKIYLNGNIKINKNLNTISLSLKSNNINIDKLLKSIQLKNKNKGSIKIKGKIKFNIHTALYKDQKLENINGYILLDRGFKKLEIVKARFCNLPVKFILYKKNNSFIININSKKFFIKKILCCLFPTHKKKIMSGTGDINIKLKGTLAKGSKIKTTLNGKFLFHATEGRIYRLTLISKVLSIINSTEIFFGQFPDLDREGFGYKEANAIGHIKKGIIFFKKSYINGDSMEILFHGKINLNTNKVNMIVFFAPLKTIDRLIKKIPIIRNITGGNLIMIPFQVTGDIDDPTVIPLSPKAVGSEILGIIKNTIKLPFKILQPLKPKNSN